MGLARRVVAHTGQGGSATVELTCAGEVIQAHVARHAVAAVGAGQVDAHGVGVAVMHLGGTLIDVCRGEPPREVTVRLGEMHNMTVQKINSIYNCKGDLFKR